MTVVKRFGFLLHFGSICFPKMFHGTLSLVK